MTRIRTIALAAGAALTPALAFAQEVLVSPLNAGTDFSSFLLDILNFVIRIGTIVVILMLVYVGYEFVAARGNAEKISGARQMLLWTIIGALILLGSKAIAIGIQATVNAIGG